MVRALTRASKAFLARPPAGFSTAPLLSSRGTLLVARREQLPALQRAFEECAALVDNLAASIYKQGEAANAAQDYRAAADHFLRIRQSAPTSSIRQAAEYDAGAALIRLQDWTAAAGVLEAFRSAYPKHELQREATNQIAFVYRVLLWLGCVLAWIGSFMIHPLLGVIVTLFAGAVWVDALRG